MRRLGRLLGPILLPMPFSKGGGFFVIGNIFKKKSFSYEFFTLEEVFLSLKYEESIKNSYVALRALLHVEMMLQR